ncbi:MAG TPA: tetratricopeptide repeat protein [Candidatus Sulfotelmatobacter sp.]|nr:tetratricopeptide repeat protein [Candidatus Sulfotelmatobacter sp.]
MAKFRQDRSVAAPWVYGPALDLIVGCGAWSAPLLALAYFSMASSTRAWSIAFYALALLFNYPHYMATIYRAYHRSEDFHKYRIFTVHLTALMVATLLLSHYWYRMLPWIFTIYLTWSPWHYSGQNYGLFMMFARRAGADPGKAERRALYGVFIVSYLILFLGFHTGPSTDALFISLGIPAMVSRWEQIVLFVLFIVLTVFGFSGLSRATGWRKLTPAVTLFSSQCLWFLVPAAISLIKGLDIPQSRYSSGVMAVMHSAQYLWITSYYARREATAEKGRDWRPFAYFAVLVIGGIALFVPGPWLASRIFHRDFTSSFLIFTALVNIHHFILDGAIWKLRDGRIAALLLNSRERMADAAAEAGTGLAAAWRWMTGSTPRAHSLRVSAAVLLLVWGTLDQARHYLALHSDDLNDLQHAAALDSFDSGVQLRLAENEMAAGQAHEAEASWRKAMQVNPVDPAPRSELLRFLIDQNRFDEALALTETSLKSSPRDPNLLVDHGFLLLRVGHLAEGVASWEKAIAVDPQQIPVYLYLAGELDHEGKSAAAAAYYKAFLEKISHAPAEKPADQTVDQATDKTADKTEKSKVKRPAPDQLIAIVLRMADCQQRASQTAQAVKSYELAQTLASRTKLPRLESVAAVDEASLQAKAGRLGQALTLYQRALLLDGATADREAGAEDWFSYGRFLDDAGFPARLAYACLVKSEGLMQSVPGGKPPATLLSEKARLEKKIANQAVAVRQDPTRALEEALALRE